MAKIQNFKRIVVEDFDQKDRVLVSKLAYSINVFAEELINSFNKNITIDDNINIIKKDITVTVDGSGDVVSGGTLKTGLTHICQGVLVIKATNVTTSSNYPTGTPFITFTEREGLLTLINITNLTASEQYKLRVILF